MAANIKFIDAFKQNNAPYFILVKRGGYEQKVYEQEAYTEAYMIRSQITGQLCRWVVVVDGVAQSMLSYFGVKVGKNKANTVARMLDKMTKEERIEFIKYIFEERFTCDYEASDYLQKFNNYNLMETEPEKLVLATFQRFSSEVMAVLMGQA